jgi:hypothetical protein
MEASNTHTPSLQVFFSITQSHVRHGQPRRNTHREQRSAPRDAPQRVSLSFTRNKRLLTAPNPPETRSVYPAIDPQPLYVAQTYSGKVVLVTGASRGIGQEISLQYARAGAVLAIAARTEDALFETKRAILDVVPCAEVLVLVIDVRDALSAERAVQRVLARFGKLDIVVANAGAISPIEHSTCSAVYMPLFV